LDDLPFGAGLDTRGASPGSIDSAGFPSVSSRFVLIGADILGAAASVASAISSRCVSVFELATVSIFGVSFGVVLASVGLSASQNISIKMVEVERDKVKTSENILLLVTRFEAEDDGLWRPFVA
jgi:hypothetical protein